MQKNYTTSRLLLNELSYSDAEFIFRLTNTPEWKKFIGDRHINIPEDATGYIHKILSNPHINYWVVKIAEKEIPIGIITFIKREYLDHHDIGFAFLKEYTKQGYAYEATSAVLNDLMRDPVHSIIFATTIKENSNSIKLLEKSGFHFCNEITVDSEKLLLFSNESNEQI
jgi:ribosomal-protein-alanine N-acetyltransferase